MTVLTRKAPIVAALMFCLLSCSEEQKSETSSANTEVKATTERVSDSAGISAFDLSNTDLIARGEQLYLLCAACHEPVANRARKIGPHLEKILDRDVASVEGFPYSGAMKNQPGNWDVSLLDAYLKSPMETIPGNMMAFQGVKDDKSRAAIIAYLSTL
jgi:cytochrome c2